MIHPDQNRFARIAESYAMFEELVDPDDAIVQVEINKVLKDIVQSINTETVSVFEAGCGIGNTTEQILRASPRIRLHSVDLDPEMVEMTKSRLASFQGERLKIETMHVRDALKSSPQISIFVSALTLHNIQSFVTRFETLVMSYDRLKSGGIFIDCDKIASADISYWQHYERRIRDIGVLARHGRSDLVDFWRRHEREDRSHVLTLEMYTELLSRIGFVDVQLEKSIGLYKLVTARKP